MPVRTLPLIGLDGDSPRARRSNPSTSHEAADSNNVNASIGLVLALLTDKGPLADHEIVAAIPAPFTPQRLRTARAALVERGLVEASGYYRMTEHNRRAVVWSIVQVAA